MKVSVLGCGRWGSCIAWYLDKTGHEVLSCGLPDAPEFIQLKTTRKNDYLSFPESIEVSDDLEYAVNRAEVIIISISSQYLRSYFEDISRYNLDGKIIVLCMKGVEVTTGKRLSQVVGDFADTSKTPVAVWVGPGHPQDYVKGVPNCMVIDSDNEEIKTLDDLKGKKTANSPNSTYAMRSEAAGAEVVYVDTLGETMELLQQGRVEATLNAKDSVDAYLAEHPEAQIKVVLSVAGEPVAIPMQKGERTETLVAEINRILEEARQNGKLAELSNKYFGRDLTKEE